MKMLKNLKKALLAVVLAAIMLVPAAFAYGSAYPYLYNNGYSQPRIGAYTTQFSYAQGMYDYVSSPIGLTRYGASYNWGSNVRSAYYPQYPVARVPNLYRPYYGYPYGSYGSQSWTLYKYYSLH